MGWIGSAALTEALILSPCGCELAAEADREADPRAQAEKLKQAAQYRKAWRCPCAGHAEPPDGAPLEGRQARSVQAVERLVGGTGEERAFSTCPLWYTRLPWMHEATRAHGWWAKSQLAVLDPHPSAALVDAVDVVERSVRAREADDLRPERVKQKAGR